MTLVKGRHLMINHSNKDHGELTLSSGAATNR
jgi:hypothetical protein